MIAVDRVKNLLGIVSPSNRGKIKDAKNTALPKERSMYPKDCPFEGSCEACKECVVWKENVE